MPRPAVNAVYLSARRLFFPLPLSASASSFGATIASIPVVSISLSLIACRQTRSPTALDPIAFRTVCTRPYTRSPQAADSPLPTRITLRTACSASAVALVAASRP